MKDAPLTVQIVDQVDEELMLNPTPGKFYISKNKLNNLTPQQPVQPNNSEASSMDDHSEVDADEFATVHPRRNRGCCTIL